MTIIVREDQGERAPPGEVVDTMTGRRLDVDTIGRGAISPTEWRALARAVLSAKVACGGAIGWIIEVGTLGGKTTRGILHLLNYFGWEDTHLLTIDKEARCGGVMSPEIDFFHGTARRYFKKLQGSQGGVAPVRFAFIDGCHCQECVREDIEAIVPHTREGSVLAFHDAADQRTRGMLVHERYHGDGRERFYGVSEAIVAATVRGPMGGWKQIATVDPFVRPDGSPTPIMGGLQVWQR